MKACIPGEAARIGLRPGTLPASTGVGDVVVPRVSKDQFRKTSGADPKMQVWRVRRGFGRMTSACPCRFDLPHELPEADHGEGGAPRRALGETSGREAECLARHASGHPVRISLPWRVIRRV